MFDIFSAARLFELEALVGELARTEEFFRTATPVGPVVFLPEGPLTPTERLYHLVHGAQHVASYWRHGADGFGERFRDDPEFRLAFEIEAFEALAEVRYWLAGLLPTHFEHNLALAHGYAAPAARIPADVIATLRERLARSEFLTEAGRHTILWLREHHPGLCACAVP